MFRIYARPGCPACQQAINLIQQATIPFEVIDVLNDPVIRNGLMVMGADTSKTLEEISRTSTDAVPVIVCFSPQLLIRGFNQEKILYAIKQYHSFSTFSEPLAATTPDQQAVAADQTVTK